MKWLQKSVVAGVLLICLGGSIYLIWQAGKNAQPTPKETQLGNILQFILSSAYAGLSGFMYARLGASEKVDTIAKSSTEKMVHLSLQLQRLSFFLRETRQVAKDQELHEALSTYGHRTDSAAEMAASLAASSETFRADWLGVASESTRRSIEEKYQDLRSYTQDWDTLEMLQERRETLYSDEESQKVNERIEQLEKKLLETTKRLPMQALVFRQQITTSAPAVSVSQMANEATAERQVGVLLIKVLRPVFMVTGTGKLVPNMTSTPSVWATLLSAPPNLDPSTVKCTAGAGTNFDFSVHLKSMVYGAQLPVGEYLCKYVASVPAQSSGTSTRVAVQGQISVGNGDSSITPDSEQTGGAPLQTAPQFGSPSQGEDELDETRTGNANRPTRASAQISVKCPNPLCGRGLPVTFREGRTVVSRACFRCYAKLKIARDGTVIQEGEYAVLDATPQPSAGGPPNLCCPKCGCVWPVLEGHDGIIHAFCTRDSIVLRCKTTSEVTST